ncbi:MAG: hypothetical protein K6E33_04475 [Lachnospiraceae bacterium]|nr:hypothetical protein [Lachnospiraceae bacterium]
MIIFKLISLIFWLGLIPFGIGLLVSLFLPEKEISILSVTVSGYMAYWSLFEITALPFLLLGKGVPVFDSLSAVFAVLSAMVSLSGYILRRGKLRGLIPDIRPVFPAILSFAVIAFILVMNTRTAFFDGDEAYYTGQALAAQQTGYLYYRSPYTGTWAYFDSRHALAMLPVWEAFIGKMSGLHAAVINHTVMSFVMIPLSMGAAALAAGTVLKKRSSLCIFTALYGAALVFSRMSIYNRGTFLITRTSQGKAAAAGFFMTLLLWLIFISMEQYRENRTFPLLLMLSGPAVGLFSSLALLLCMMFLFTAFALYAILKKSLRPLIYAGLSCVPQFLYLLLYMGAGS